MIRRWTSLLLCLLAVPAVAHAQTLADYDYEHLSFQGIGLDYGYIWPTKVESAPAYSLRLDLGFLGPAVRIVPSITYWNSRLEDDELARLADQLNQLGGGASFTAEEFGEIEWSDLSFNLDGQYAWDVGGSVLTYLGAGAGIHLLNGRGDAIADTFVEDLLDSVTAGLAAAAGVEFEPLDRFRLYAEARYTLLDDVRYPGVRIGGAIMLPGREGSARAADTGILR